MHARVHGTCIGRRADFRCRARCAPPNVLPRTRIGKTRNRSYPRTKRLTGKRLSNPCCSCCALRACPRARQLYIRQCSSHQPRNSYAAQHPLAALHRHLSPAMPYCRLAQSYTRCMVSGRNALVPLATERNVRCTRTRTRTHLGVS